MINRQIVKFIAQISPYFAPLPSAYFVARSSINHMDIPILIGIVIGIVVETLGFSSVHTWLWVEDWNNKSKKSDPKGPSKIALALVLIYLIVTICLTVVLEIDPRLSLAAPAFFPILAMVGAIELVLISQQEQREFEVSSVQKERIEKRRSSVQAIVQVDSKRLSNLVKKDSSLDLANAARRRNKANILDRIQSIIFEHPDIGVTELARATGVKSRTTIYSYLDELKKSNDSANPANRHL